MLVNPSFRTELKNFLKPCFKLHSNPLFTRVLKIASYTLLTLSGVGLSIKAYSQYSDRIHRAIKALSSSHNIKAIDSFCQEHPNFASLIRKIEKSVSFQDIGFRNEINSRLFKIGKDEKGENKIFIKYPCGKHMFIRQERAKNEQLAFLISHRLGLDVVPATICLKGYKIEIEKILPKSTLSQLKCGFSPETYKSSYDGVVVQEALSLKDNQENLDRTSEQIQKAIIFNLITGRADAERNNTVITQSGKLMEIDNEKLGFLKESSSWLLTEFEKTNFSEEVITSLLSKPTETITQIFEEMESFNFPKELQENIITNFKEVTTFFSLNRDRQITVENLITFLKKPSKKNHS